MSISVAENRWPYTHKVTKDPNSTLDYQLDWSSWLVDGESINDATVTVSGATKISSSFTSTTTTVWVSGGTTGSTASILFHITTDSSPHSRIDDRTLILHIAER